MDDRRQVLREAFNFVEAETIRIRLLDADIPAVVTGTDAAVALSMGGAGTDRLVRVEVAEDDFERADKILRADEARMRDAKPWICGRCGEPNEPAFEVCWSCEKPLSDSDVRGRQNMPRASEFTVDTVPPPQGASATVDSDPNPYRPVELQREPSEVQANVDWELESDLEAQVRRAFLSSIVGTLVCPPLVNFYSLALILTVPNAGYQRPKLHHRLLLAWGINILSIAAWAMIWFSYRR